MGKSEINIVHLIGEEKAHDTILGQGSFALTINKLANLYARQAAFQIVLVIYKNTLADFLNNFLFVNSFGQIIGPDYRFYWQVNFEDNFSADDYLQLHNAFKKIYLSPELKLYDNTLSVFQSLEKNNMQNTSQLLFPDKCGQCLSKKYCQQGTLHEYFNFSPKNKLNNNFCNFMHFLNILNQEVLCYDINIKNKRD